MKDILDKYESLPFKWGYHDCCLFSANVVRDTTGKDYAEEFRGKYSSKEEAFNLVKDKYDADDLAELFNKITNQEMRTDWDNIELGDFVAFDRTGEVVIGINYGDRSYFVTTTGERYLKIPNRRCKGFWKVNK